MAAPQLRPKSIHVARSAAAKRTPRAIRKGAGEAFEPDRAPTQFHFRTEPDRVTARETAILASLAIVVIGAIAALGYLLGIVAAAVAAAAVGGLIAFGNWVLNNTIEF